MIKVGDNVRDKTFGKFSRGVVIAISGDRATIKYDAGGTHDGVSISDLEVCNAMKKTGIYAKIAASVRELMNSEPSCAVCGKTRHEAGELDTIDGRLVCEPCSGQQFYQQPNSNAAPLTCECGHPMAEHQLDDELNDKCTRCDCLSAMVKENSGRFKLGDVVRMTKAKQDRSLWRGDDVICSIVTVYEPGDRFDYQLKVRVKGDSNTGSTEVKESEIELANSVDQGPTCSCGHYKAAHRNDGECEFCGWKCKSYKEVGNSKWLSAVPSACQACKQPFTGGVFHDAPTEPGGPWGLICEACSKKGKAAGATAGQKYDLTTKEKLNAGDKTIKYKGYSITSESTGDVIVGKPNGDYAYNTYNVADAKRWIDDRSERGNAAYKGARVYSRINPTDHGTVVETDGDSALVDWDGSGKAWIGQRDLVRMEKTNSAASDFEHHVHACPTCNWETEREKLCPKGQELYDKFMTEPGSRMGERGNASIPRCPNCGDRLYKVKEWDDSTSFECRTCGDQNVKPAKNSGGPHADAAFDAHASECPECGAGKPCAKGLEIKNARDYGDLNDDTMVKCPECGKVQRYGAMYSFGACTDPKCSFEVTDETVGLGLPRANSSDIMGQCKSCGHDIEVEENSVDVNPTCTCGHSLQDHAIDGICETCRCPEFTLESKLYTQPISMNANASKACPSCGAEMHVSNPQAPGLIQRQCTKCGEETQGEEGLREYGNTVEMVYDMRSYDEVLKCKCGHSIRQHEEFGKEPCEKCDCIGYDGPHIGDAATEAKIKKIPMRGNSKGYCPDCKTELCECGRCHNVVCGKSPVCRRPGKDTSPKCSCGHSKLDHVGNGECIKCGEGECTYFDLRNTASPAKKCPECGKEMWLIDAGDERVWTCVSCEHHEKANASSFKKGDRVRVVRLVKDPEGEEDITPGATGVVSDVSGGLVSADMNPGGPWQGHTVDFLPADLELKNAVGDAEYDEHLKKCGICSKAQRPADLCEKGRDLKEKGNASDCLACGHSAQLHDRVDRGCTFKGCPCQQYDSREYKNSDPFDPNFKRLADHLGSCEKCKTLLGNPHARGSGFNRDVCQVGYDLDQKAKFTDKENSDPDKEALSRDVTEEESAIRLYEKQAADAKRPHVKELIEHVVKDEREHVREFEEQLKDVDKAGAVENDMTEKRGEYNGVRYKVQFGGDAGKSGIWSGYDNDGFRIIFAMSKEEFERKVDSGSTAYAGTKKARDRYLKDKGRGNSAAKGVRPYEDLKYEVKPGGKIQVGHKCAHGGGEWLWYDNGGRCSQCKEVYSVPESLANASSAHCDACGHNHPAPLATCNTPTELGICRCPKVWKKVEPETKNVEDAEGHEHDESGKFTSGGEGGGSTPAKDPVLAVEDRFDAEKKAEAAAKAQAKKERMARIREANKKHNAADEDDCRSCGHRRSKHSGNKCSDCYAGRLYAHKFTEKGEPTAPLGDIDNALTPKEQWLFQEYGQAGVDEFRKAKTDTERNDVIAYGPGKGNPNFGKGLKNANDMTNIPAAACGKCGGWTDFGGMSQHADSKVPVSGRTGCTCRGKWREGADGNPPGYVDLKDPSGAEARRALGNASTDDDRTMFGVRYRKGMKSTPGQKFFKTADARSKWVEQQGGDIEVDAYTDPQGNAVPDIQTPDSRENARENAFTMICPVCDDAVAPAVNPETGIKSCSKCGSADLLVDPDENAVPDIQTPDSRENYGGRQYGSREYQNDDDSPLTPGAGRFSKVSREDDKRFVVYKDDQGNFQLFDRYWQKDAGGFMSKHDAYAKANEYNRMRGWGI